VRAAAADHPTLAERVAVQPHHLGGRDGLAP
jgi:hypothetical protein